MRLRRFAGRIQIALITVLLLSLAAACTGPSGDSTGATATEPVLPTSSPIPTAQPEASETATDSPASAETPTATREPATAQPSLTPALTLPVTPALKPTLSPEPDQPAPVDATPWLPDERPADQVVELPDLDLHYDLHISELSVSTGYVRASELVTIREFRSFVPDLLHFQVPPAGYGFFTLDGITLNGAAVEPDWLNGGATMVLDLPENIAAPVEIGIDFQLNVGGPEPEGWGYLAVDADVLRLGYWFPQISDDHPFSVTLDPSYTRVAEFDVTLDIDAGLEFSHSGEVTGSAQPGANRMRYYLHGENIRDFDFAFSPSYRFASTYSATGVFIEYAWRADSPDVSAQVLATTAEAVDRLSELIGPYPWPSLRIADGGPALPGGIEYGTFILINPYYSQLDRLIYHEVAHMWLYGIIGTRTLDEGWIDEGGAEFFERGLASDFTELALYPAGGYCCWLDSRWEELPQSGSGTYFAIYEQGQRFYMAVLEAMGWDPFWAAMQEIYADFALDIVTGYDMLRTWQAHSPVDLRPLYHEYFRYPWIDDLPPPGVTAQQGWLSVAPDTSSGD